MENNPKISIIISAYNAKDYLNECMDSIINQTLADIEIICVNDGSTDNSLKILKEYASKDDRIIIIDQQNQGLACSRNNALKIAKGEYFLCVDADDHLRLDTLESLYNKAKSTNLDMLSFSGVNFDNKTRKTSINDYWEFKYLPPNFNTNCFNYKNCANFIEKMAVSSCLTLYRLEFIKTSKINFPAGLCFEDNLFFCKSITNAKRCGILNEKFYQRRIHSESITQNWEKHFGDYLKISALVLEYLKSIKIDFTIYNNYITYYVLGCIKRYNNYSNNIRAIYYDELKSFVEKYDSSLKPLVFRPLKGFAKIFSIKNQLATSKKVLTICGKQIKFKSRKLKEQQKIFELERNYKKLNNYLQNLKLEQCQQMQELRNEYQTMIKKYCAPEMRHVALADWYYERTGEVLNLDNPQTFNEKIQWMKLYDSTPIKTRLADKYLVRDWVKEQIGEEYLIPLLGVWDNFDEINFEELPNQFVLKCNHGCGYNIIVKDKSTFDIEKARNKINAWMKEDFAFKNGFEMHYTNIPRKIIAEKYIENDGGDLYDYKIWCFNGEARYIQFLSERNTDGLKMAFYDREWNKQDFYNDFAYDSKIVSKPQNLDLLLRLSETLSKDINYVRIDFYITNDGQIYFGEMTFTPTSGACTWDSYQTDLMLGQMIELNSERSFVQ